jgi:hypothetical protein
MKISKRLLVLCALAMGATCLSVRAEDNPAQAAARIALAKQLFGASTQPPQAAAVQTAASPTAQPLDENQLAAQRAAQMAALAAGLPARPAVETTAKTNKPHSPAALAAKPAVAVAPPPASQPAVTAPPSAKPAEANYAGKDLGMKPIVAPALPITASKEDRLAALLMKYKADQISPEEYHTQRAAILAEP